jgi:hypothetical protein
VLQKAHRNFLSQSLKERSSCNRKSTLTSRLSRCSALGWKKLKGRVACYPQPCTYEPHLLWRSLSSPCNVISTTQRTSWWNGLVLVEVILLTSPRIRLSWPILPQIDSPRNTTHSESLLLIQHVRNMTQYMRVTVFAT